MTTPTDRVRAALERADVMIYGSHHDNEQLKTALACIKEALSELDGMCLVPVEPTQERLDKMAKFAIAARLSSEYTWRDYVRDLYGIVISEHRG